jgi:hypothetical protein
MGFLNLLQGRHFRLFKVSALVEMHEFTAML